MTQGDVHGAGRGNLDLEPTEFRRALDRASEMVVRYYGRLESGEAAPEAPSDPFANLPMPSAGEGVLALLDELESKVLDRSLPLAGPRFLMHIPSAGTHAGILGALLSAAINQNCALAEMSGPAAEIEQNVIGWLAEFIGYPKDAAGLLTSGGSMANLTCTAVAARAKATVDIASEGIGSSPPLTVYISSEGHACHTKNMALLGLGSKYLRRIPAGPGFTIDLERLVLQIEQDIDAGLRPVCVIGNGGTARTGAVDPLSELADICDRYGLWFHVDAAYGGPAAGTEAARELFEGLDRSDSLALDPHKWLFVPYEAGCAIVRDREKMRRTFSFRPDYALAGADSGPPDFAEFGPQLSRDFKALKVYLTFKTYGADGLRQAIQANIETAREFGGLVETSHDFELLAPVTLSIVCFRHLGSTPERRSDEEYLGRLNEQLLQSAREAGFYLTPTVVDGKPGIRICCTNHRTDLRILEELLSVLRRAARAVGQ